MKDSAILVVSFGTSYTETCTNTIERIEQEIRTAYSEYAVYRAWTGGKIRRKLEERDGIHIFSVEEAMAQMHQDGIRKLIVQPTHVLDGIENHQMIKAVEEAAHLFEKVEIGAPLLTTQKDNEFLVQMMIEEWNIKEDEMVIFMGHGTEHDSNYVYAALNYQFQKTGHDDMVVGTVEGYPEISDMVQLVKQKNVKKVFLTPFMIVAGEHANHDMAGEGPDSWKTVFEKEGYEVECVLKGLAEYPAVRRLILQHLEMALDKMNEQNMRKCC